MPIPNVRRFTFFFLVVLLQPVTAYSALTECASSFAKLIPSPQHGRVGALVVSTGVMAAAPDFIESIWGPKSYASDLSPDEQFAIRRKINDYRKNGASSLSEAQEIAKYFGIRESAEMVKTPPQTRLKYLNDVVKEIARMPNEMRRVLAFTGTTTELVLGGITTHPSASNLKGVTPRGWPEGTWDDSSGASFRDFAIISAERVHLGHGCVSLVLHELAHNYDKSAHRTGPYLSRVVNTWTGKFKVSGTREFLELHKQYSETWESEYERTYPEEAFAEAVGKFAYSKSSREALKSRQPGIYDFLIAIFGSEDLYLGE